MTEAPAPVSGLRPLLPPSGGVTPAYTQPVKLVAPARKRLALMGVLVTTAVIVVALIAVKVLLNRPVAITASNIRAVTSEPGVEFNPVISPDGKEVTYQ